MAEDHVEFNCPHCNQLYKLTTAQLQRYAGRTTNCRKCQQPFEFPSAAPEPEPEPQPQPQVETYHDQLTQEHAAAYHETPAGHYQPPPSQPAAAAPHQPIDYRRPARTRARPTVMDYLLFRGMLTPVVIQVLFWLGVVATVYLGVMMIYAALNPPQVQMYGYGMRQPPARSMNTELLILGLVYAILGPIVVRVYCELIIVIFRILDALRDMTDVLDERLPRP